MHLGHWIGEEIIKNYGYPGKKSFKTFANINDIFFVAIHPAITHEKYKEVIKKSFKLEKNKQYKTKFLLAKIMTKKLYLIFCFLWMKFNLIMFFKDEIFVLICWVSWMSCYSKLWIFNEFVVGLRM